MYLAVSTLGEVVVAPSDDGVEVIWEGSLEDCQEHIRWMESVLAGLEAMKGVRSVSLRSPVTGLEWDVWK